MQKEITLLIGLPGSGKSHYIKEHFHSTDYTVIDDPKMPSDFPDTFDKHLVIADCHLCRSAVLESFHFFAQRKYPDAKINLIYFENNPMQCFKNVDYRNDGRDVKLTIQYASKKYVVPEDANVVKVFDTATLTKKPKTIPKF